MDLSFELSPSGPLYSSISAFLPNGIYHLSGLNGLSAAGNIAKILNGKNRNGYISARWANIALAKYPAVDGLMAWTQRLGTLPTEFGGGPCPFTLFCLLRNLDRLSSSVNGANLRASMSDINAAISSATTAGIIGTLIPTEFATFLVSGETKISRVEEVDGLDAPSMSEEQVLVALSNLIVVGV